MKFIAVFILSMFLLAACSTESGKENVDSKSDKSETASSENPDVNDTDEGASEDVDIDSSTANLKPKSKDAKASRKEIEAKDAASAGLGPTDTVRAFNDAIVLKDAAKIKSFLSADSLKSVEENAKRIGRTVDEILTTEGGGPMPREREMQNEKVTGNTAVVEVKNTVLGSFDDFHLVKEGGLWRVDLVKMEKEALEKLNKMQQDAPKVQ